VQTLRIEVQGLHPLGGQTSGKILGKKQILFDFARSMFRTRLASSLLTSCESHSTREGEKMKDKLCVLLLAGGFLVLTTLPVSAFAGGYGGAGGGGVQIPQSLHDGPHADRAKYGNGTMGATGGSGSWMHWGGGMGTGPGGMGGSWMHWGGGMGSGPGGMGGMRSRCW
jgi:hypothetical protein